MKNSVRESLIGYIWDAYKDVNGVRPRWMNFDGMNLVELKNLADSLENDIVEEIAYDRSLKEQCEMMIGFASCHPHGFIWEKDGEVYAVILPEEKFTSTIALAFMRA